MSGFIVKVHIVHVKPKILVLLQSNLNSSAEDSGNLIVGLEGLNSKLSELGENDEICEFLRRIVETTGNEVEYV